MNKKLFIYCSGFFLLLSSESFARGGIGFGVNIGMPEEDIIVEQQPPVVEEIIEKENGKEIIKKEIIHEPEIVGTLPREEVFIGGGPWWGRGGWGWGRGWGRGRRWR